jgi:hypothetical protein
MNGVVIDEVEGTVEPEPAKSADSGQKSSASREQSMDQFRHELSRLAQREARLRAD